jgi:hypothetical protein
VLQATRKKTSLAFKIIKLPWLLSPELRRHFLDAVVQNPGQEFTLCLKAHPGKIKMILD